MDSEDRRPSAEQRRENGRQPQRSRREREKQNKRTSAKSHRQNGSKSKIKDAVNARSARQRRERRENLSREEKYRRDAKKKIRNLQAQDHEDGYYVDEYAEKKRQERRARQIRRQENEIIRRNKKPLTAKQIRIRRIVISASIFALVLLIGVTLSLTVLFKTENIVVEGDSYYGEDQIVAFSNVTENQNIFIGSWNSTPEEIVANLTYIESAQIGFSIPDTIVISVQNAVPAYAVKDGDGYLIVSSKGRILDTTPTKTDDLVELKCGEIKNKTKGAYIDFGDDSVSEILHSVAQSFADNGIDKITAFDISNLSEIIIDYDGRIHINIGLPEDIDYKIKTAFTIINEKLDPNKTGLIAGTLDVSTCNKNKISRYKPSPTMPTTVPASSQPTTAPDYGDGGETDNNEYGNGGYEDYGGYDEGLGYDPYAYNGGGYDDNIYNGGYGGNDYVWQEGQW